MDNAHPSFLNEVIESILIYKWEKYAKGYFYIDAFTQLFVLMIFIINVVIIIPFKS